MAFPLRSGRHSDAICLRSIRYCYNCAALCGEVGKATWYAGTGYSLRTCRCLYWKAFAAIQVMSSGAKSIGIVSSCVTMSLDRIMLV